MKPFVIGIAGGSASGKTTFCDRLEKALEAYAIKCFHMDYYFKPERMRPHPKAHVTGKTYTDDNHPESMDTAKLRDDVVAAIEDGSYSVILVEGLLTLYDDGICGLLDLKLFVDCRADERIVRRLRRNMEWSQSYDEIADVYLDLVRYRHDQYVEPSKWRADLIINGSTLSEKALYAVLAYIDSKRDF